MEADYQATVSTEKKEQALEQRSTKRNYRVFVGVDIASRDFMAATLVSGARATRESHAYEQTAQGFERFQQRLQESGVPAVETLVVMEATGSYWIALAATLSHAGFAVSVINPAQAHYFAKAQLKRAKNDVLDAQTLAELAQALVPPCWTPPPGIYYELHQRLAQRASLLQWRTQVNNQLHALSLSPQVVPTVRARLVACMDLLNEQIAQVDEELLELVKIEQEVPAEEEPQRMASAAEDIEQHWKAAIALLQTIPGIGLLTACWLVVATLNFSLCETAQAATHYVGLAPILRSSGSSVRGRAQTGHAGHARARTQLYLATLAAVRFNPVVKSYYDRLRAAGKPMKVARCACARKLLHLAFALVKSQQPFDPHYQPTIKREEAIA